jgi:GTPase SAR1 family protein
MLLLFNHADGVGKSTLITALLTESFNTSVPSVISPVIVPASITPEHVSVVIIDSSCKCILFSLRYSSGADYLFVCVKLREYFMKAIFG